MKFFTKNFFKGILVLTPIALTVYIVYTLFRSVDDFGGRILGRWIGREDVIDGIGFLFTLALITFIGYISSVWGVSTLFKWIEDQVLKGPLVKGLYLTIKDILGFFFGKNKFFSKVVLVTVSNMGQKQMGFVTQDEPSFSAGDGDYMVVYLPHSYQVSGNMVVVPKKNVEFLDITPEAALKIIMSAGMVKK